MIRRVAAGLTLLVASTLSLSACRERRGCMGGDDGLCVPPSPCTGVVETCSDTTLEVRVVRGVEDRGRGLDAVAARGDILMRNSLTEVVIDAIESPHQLAPTGGNVTDMVPRDGRTEDGLNGMVHVVGILPEDAVAYRSAEIIDERPTLMAVVVRGTLDGRPETSVVTRYEMRPCERGIRMRTELHHAGRDPYAFFLSDGFWWGGREVTPFVPLRGQGFIHPDFDLLELGTTFRTFPFLAASTHNTAPVAYALVACDPSSLDGFQSATVSSGGLPRAIVQPGDSLHFERFLAVAAGPGLGGAVAAAGELRNQLFGERWVALRGRVTSADGAPLGGDERLGSLLVYEPGAGDEPDAPANRTPIAEVVPDAAGLWSTRVPAGRRFHIERHAFGRATGERVAVDVASDDTSAPDLVVTRGSGLVTVTVRERGRGTFAEVVLTPTGATRREDVAGTIHGFFDDEPYCAPYLGPPHAGSPACNRVLTESDGRATFAVPAGTYWVYATRGPFATIARERIEVTDGSRHEVNLSVEPIAGLVPDGVLSADFHVHGGASFDSDLPELDRARTFVAQGLDVVAATDHEVVSNYAEAVNALGIRDRVIVLAGMETTGQIPFLRPPGSDFPRVIGHFNFWPLRYDANLARNGGPDDERIEPGQLYDVMDRLYDGDGIAQLNHPYADIDFGRDQGYLTTLDLDPRDPIPDAPDDTAAGQLRRRPGGPFGHQNIDHDVQEVMNGKDTIQFHRYRAGWFAFLDQGILRGGTANSDSHTLAVQVLGNPRNLVLGGHTIAAFDADRFHDDVRHGRMIGTNGPVLIVSMPDASGVERGPSIDPFVPADDALLSIELRAAPWIPVEEIRVIVNGEVAWVERTEIEHPSDPFGVDGIDRWRGTIPLHRLLEGTSGDAWIVVEAGYPLHPAGDVDDDGIIETTDNDGNGVIDERDQAGLDEEDYYEEPAPPDEGDPRFHLDVCVPGAWPTAFSNPFVLDRDGGGFRGPGIRR